MTMESRASSFTFAKICASVFLSSAENGSSRTRTGRLWYRVRARARRFFEADSPNHFLRALFSAEADIVFHTSMKQLRIVAEITDDAVPVCFFHFSKLFSAESDASLIR